MIKSIKNKLLSLFLISLLVALLISLGIHLLFFRPYFLNFTENKLISIYTEINQNIERDDFEVFVSEIGFKEQLGIVVSDINFEYVFIPHILSTTTKNNLILESKYLIDTIDVDLEKSYICVQLNNSMIENDDAIERMFFIQKLSNGYYCILSHQLETLENNINAMNQFHIIVGLIACLFGVITTIFFSKSFTKPIIEINAITQKMSHFDFGSNIQYNSQDELGQLSQNINILSNNLEEYQIALKKEIEFQKILSQNISHELKTPIAVMKGYLEAISYGIASKKGKVEEYTSIVLNECEQMTLLIDQMLELSKLTSALEHTFDETIFSSSDFNQIIKNKHNALLEHKNIEFICNIQELQLRGNLELVSQCIGNFITNAIKYGDNVKIVFEIKEEKNYSIYSVFNTGSTISKPEQEKIFDVFYMIDKARSRKYNSHGLGLTVCKSVADIHKGSVFCENKDNGVIFYLKIPNDI